MKSFIQLICCTILISLVGCAVEKTTNQDKTHVSKITPHGVVQHDKRTRLTPDTH